MVSVVIDIPLSVLEIPSFVTAHPAVDVQGILDVAQAAERSGYRRIWYAEHHGSLAFAAFPPTVVAARVAAATTGIRVGSGGVLAVNHAPISLAEQFSALTSFFPGRIDLGIGRGPGTFDEALARALRHGADPATEAEYHHDVAEILRLVGAQADLPEPWMLASSPAGAALAASLGLPMAFAYHIRPQNAAETIERYRQAFRPSEWSETPRVMLSVETVCAETEAEAAVLARPSEINRAGHAVEKVDQPLLDVATAATYELTAEENEVVTALRATSAQGTPEMVQARLTELAGRFEADELILWTPIANAKDRARSVELVML
jgi:luciferase family oxidoreductase group 1